MTQELLSYQFLPRHHRHFYWITNIFTNHLTLLLFTTPFRCTLYKLEKKKTTNYNQLTTNSWLRSFPSLSLSKASFQVTSPNLIIFFFMDKIHSTSETVCTFLQSRMHRLFETCTLHWIMGIWDNPPSTAFYSYLLTIMEGSIPLIFPYHKKK